jgi:hypothetical protein
LHYQAGFQYNPWADGYICLYEADKQSKVVKVCAESGCQFFPSKAVDQVNFTYSEANQGPQVAMVKQNEILKY